MSSYQVLFNLNCFKKFVNSKHLIHFRNLLLISLAVMYFAHLSRSYMNLNHSIIVFPFGPAGPRVLVLYFSSCFAVLMLSWTACGARRKLYDLQLPSALVLWASVGSGSSLS